MNSKLLLDNFNLYEKRRLCDAANRTRFQMMVRVEESRKQKPRCARVDRFPSLIAERRLLPGP